jgi:hypothetical protein
MRVGPARALVTLALDGGITVRLGEGDRPYATLGPRTWPLRSPEFARWLLYLWNAQAARRVLREEELHKAIRLLERTAEALRGPMDGR